MMNKIMTLLLSLAVALGCAAQGNLSDNQRLLGHTVTDDIDIRGAVVGQPGTYTIGAVVESDVLQAYKGCRVVGIRMAAAVDLGRTRVFLDGITDDGLTSLQSKTQKVYEGWNEVFFNGDGYTISGNESLFFGFDYVETQEMLNAEKGGIASTGTDTTGAFMIYMNGGLYPVSQVGKLCVQLIVDVTNLPADNMMISFFDTGFKYKRVGETIEVFAMVNNVGRDAVKSFTVGCRFDDCQPDYISVDEVAIASGAQDSWQDIFDMPAELGAGSHTMTLWIDKVNSTDLGYAASRARTVNFATYVNSMERNGAYLEIYNDQNSPYAAMLNPVMNGMDSETFVVNVHAPGTSLALTDAAYLHGLYAYTTPSFTVNRSYFPGENHVAYDMNDFLGLVDQAFLSMIIEDIVAQDKTTVSFAGLQLSAKYDPATRLLTVEASGEALPEAESIYGQLALTLMAVEDNVSGSQILSSGAVSRKYTHRNVLRGYLTAPYGSPLTVEGGSFSAAYTMTLPAGWKAENLKVTGILTKAADSWAAINDANVRDYDVINAASAKVEAGAGIEAVAPDSAEVEGYYNLQGIRVDADALVPGIYLRRYTDGRTEKALIR